MKAVESWLVHDKWDAYEEKTVHLGKCVGYLSQMNETHTADLPSGSTTSDVYTRSFSGDWGRRLFRAAFGLRGARDRGSTEPELLIELERHLPDGMERKRLALVPCEDYLQMACKGAGTLVHVTTYGRRSIGCFFRVPGGERTGMACRTYFALECSDYVRSLTGWPGQAPTTMAQFL